MVNYWIRQSVQLLAGALFLCVVSAHAATLYFYDGQILYSQAARVWITDQAPGTVQSLSYNVTVSGNVIGIYATLSYNPGTAHPSFSIFTALGPSSLLPGDYEIDYYTATYPVGGAPPEFTLINSFPLTVLAFSDMRRTYEYFDAQQNHYFITSDPNEIAALDSGHFPGWARTGQQFWSFTPSQTVPPNLAAVCRFYGLPQAGLDSHFFTASASECQYVQEHWSYAWQLESPNVFYVIPIEPTISMCPGSTFPVYRLFNNRPDINHRYTTSTAIVDQMVAQGWLLEGIVWCDYGLVQ